MRSTHSSILLGTLILASSIAHVSPTPSTDSYLSFLTPYLPEYLGGTDAVTELSSQVGTPGPEPTATATADLTEEVAATDPAPVPVVTVTVTTTTTTTMIATSFAGTNTGAAAQPTRAPPSKVISNAEDTDVMLMFEADRATPAPPPGRGRPVARVVIPAITASRTYWAAPAFLAGQQPKAALAPWHIVKDAYGANNRRLVPDPVDTGSVVLQAIYPKGSSNPGGDIVGGTGLYAEPMALKPNRPVWLQYDVYFDKDFDFVQGGKLPGLYGGHPSCSGGTDAEDCFSSRMMFREGGQGEAYIYIPRTAPRNHCGKVPAPKSICNPEYGDSLARGSFTFLRGSWNTVTLYVHPNTPGKQDGGIKMWHNGRKVLDFSSIMWRKLGNVHVRGIDFETFFGGNGDEWAPKRSTRSLFRRVRMGQL